MVSNHFGIRKVRKLEKICRMTPLVILSAIFSALVSSCDSVAAQPGYFLFTPPFGGDRPPQELALSKRNGAGDSTDVAPLSRAHITPSETLWVGSHKINWDPLPIFQQIINHHQQKQQQRFAQARKFELNEQQPRAQKGPLFSTRSFKNNFGHNQRNPPHKKPLFLNPHHDFSNKFASGGFFAGLGAAIGAKDAPKVIPPSFAQPRSSSQPERDHAEPPRSQPTTPLPVIQSSTGGTILVSPPGTIAVLSTPGPNLSPIVNRLRKMTEWSKHRSTVMKKEGKPNSSQEKRLRLKKRTRPETKQHKHNIEAIILSNDDDDASDSASVERNNIRIVKANLQATEKLPKPTKSIKRKRKSRGRNVSKEQFKRGSVSTVSSEEILASRALQRPHNDLVVIHPTNAAFLHDPLDVQQSARRSYELRRKDKGLSFKTEDAANAPAPPPVSFRFGADDAKPNPYFNN